MRLSRQDIEQAARLVQLRLDEEVLTGHQTALSQVASLLDTVRDVTCEGVEPLISPLEITQRLRDDTVTQTNQRDSYQSTAPAVENGLYLVPKVLD